MFFLVITLVILIRTSELLLSARNEKWVLKNKAVEYGKSQYPFIIIVHALFLLSTIYEYFTSQNPSFSLIFFLSYCIVIVVKAWIILSLGKFWNTKIYHIAGVPLVTKGPYKYFKHPNYLVVIAEIALIPLIFHLYYTALIFSFLNGIVLFVRIRTENKVLKGEGNERQKAEGRRQK